MCYSRVMPDIQWHSGADREVSVRDLRNRTSEVLRRVEAGETVTVTVDRRPAARLVPLSRRGRPESMPASEFFAPLAELGGGAHPAPPDDLPQSPTAPTPHVTIP